MSLPVAVRAADGYRYGGGRLMLVPLPEIIDPDRVSLRMRCSGCTRVVLYGSPKMYRFNFAERVIEVTIPPKEDCDHELIFEYVE